jgi:hypothetical protein
VADILVESLLEFYTTGEISTAWETVFNAHISQLENDVVITSQNTVAGGASGQIVVTPTMRLAFMTACKNALAQANESEAPPVAGHFLRWNYRRIET